jgi:phosphoesterase RecJ-like protein
MILTKELQQRFDVREGETEGLVNVPLTIADVRLSLFLKEDDGHFRVSIRSKKGTSAQQLAVKYFHGGGHENAAGGKLFIGKDILRAEDAVAYVESALKSFLR